jgi:hypothetical protein
LGVRVIFVANVNVEGSTPFARFVRKSRRTHCLRTCLA